MREIRFRQWDGTRNKFYFGIGIARDGGFNSPPMVNWDRYPMDQYTGLKDKNGVDIYEGDIVSFSDPFGNPTITPIFWHEGQAGFCWTTEWGDRMNYCSDAQSRSVVIGNIHENKDILP